MTKDKTARLYRMVMPDHLCPFGLKSRHLLQSQGFEIEDHTLTVSGEMGDTIERENDRYHYRERHFGAFQRSVRLPNTVDTEGIDANVENGVLNIVLPKLPQAQPKQIAVKANDKNK